MLIVDHSVRCEMHRAVLPQLRARRQLAAGRKIQRFQLLASISELRDQFGLLAAEPQPHKVSKTKFPFRPSDFIDWPGCHPARLPSLPLDCDPWVTPIKD